MRNRQQERAQGQGEEDGNGGVQNNNLRYSIVKQAGAERDGGPQARSAAPERAARAVNGGHSDKGERNGPEAQRPQVHPADFDRGGFEPVEQRRLFKIKHTVQAG